MKKLTIWLSAVLLFTAACHKRVVVAGGSSPPGVTPVDCSKLPEASYPGLKVDHSGSARIYTVDIDAVPKPPETHAEICLSVENDDVVLWKHSDDRKLSFPEAHSDVAGCKNPFKGSHPKEFRDFYQSGELDNQVIGCHYTLKFERQSGPPTDPHIVIGGK